MNNRGTLTPDELVKFFLSREKRADLNKTEEEDTPNGLMQEEIVVEPLEDQESEDALDFLQRMIMSQSGKVAEAKESLGEQLADIKEKALANIDTIKNTQLKSQPNPFIGGPLSPMLTEEGVEQEVEKIVDPMLRDPEILDIPPKLFDESAQQTEKALTDAEIADIATSAIDAVEEEPKNAEVISDLNDADGGAASGKEFDDTVKAFLELNEGNENTPYKDTLGNWTVGIGHYIGKTLPERFRNANGTPKTLTDTQVQMLFEKDYKEHKEDAAKLPMYDSLDNKGKQALIDLTFNMGSEVFSEDKWPKFFAALKNKDLETAAKELKNSKWYNQVGDRAPRVINLIKGAEFN